MNCNNKITYDKDCNLYINEVFNPNYVQVFIIKFTNSSFSDVIQTSIIEEENQKIIIKNAQDGFYTICKLTIPIDSAQPYYYKNGKFYHNIWEVDLQELIELNPKVSKIKIEYIYYFSLCNISKCFIKICQDIFSQQTSICNKLNIDNSLIYKRDLIWSTINIIKYMADMDQIEEALRLLEEITSCNGLCPQSEFNNCGCNG